MPFRFQHQILGRARNPLAVDLDRAHSAEHLFEVGPQALGTGWPALWVARFALRELMLLGRIAVTGLAIIGAFGRFVDMPAHRLVFCFAETRGCDLVEGAAIPVEDGGQAGGCSDALDGHVDVQRVNFDADADTASLVRGDDGRTTA